MLVLSYLGILALIPLLTEKNDGEVQWHAKNGLVLLVAYLVLMVGVVMASFVVGFIGMLQIPLWLGYLVVIILGITNALNGKRLVIPGLSEFTAKF
jgi:uncharacterized membrane protein